MKIMVLINKNGINSLIAFFFINDTMLVAFSLSDGIVRQNRNPDIKKNNGM